MQHGCAGRRDNGCTGRKDWDSVRFHHTTQNGIKPKIYELITSRIFHLIFLGRG